MSNEECVNRGSLIKPSARKSIHSHRFCIFARKEYDMGRYGVNFSNGNKDLSGPSNRQGRDEVDNIMSKFASPIDIYNSSNFKRRNSMSDNIRNDDNEEDDLRHCLSKSLPTTFPSHSYYSNDSSESQDECQTSFHTAAPVSLRSNQSLNGESSFEREPSIVLERAHTIHQNKASERNTNSQNSSCVLRWPFLIVILACIVTACGNFITRSNVIQNVIYDKNRFFNDMVDLGNKYKVNSASIEQVQIGISSILEKEDADSFVFVYDSKCSSFDADEFNKFMNEIAFITSKYLRNETSSVHHTVVDGAALNMRDSSELIDKYSNDLKNTGVMLVKEISSVPSTLAMAFHYYCDEYNPIAKKSAIFLTLDIAKCSIGMNNKSSHATIEKCLANKWIGVPSDNMGPLLTRVVSVVVDVTNGFTK